MKFFDDFLRGSEYVFSGCRAFYGDSGAWKYAAFPLVLMTGAYILLFRLVLYFSGRGAELINKALAGLPGWLRWLTSIVSCLSTLLGVLFALFVLGTTVSTLYELFGGFFFGSLVEYYGKKQFGHVPRRQSLERNLKYCLDSLLFGVMTSSLFFFLFILGLFFPIAGQLLLVGVMGYCMGIAYMVMPANTLGLSLAEMRARIDGRRGIILGFGLTGYLLFLIPFATLLFLPGLVLGGAELVNRELPDRF